VEKYAPLPEEGNRRTRKTGCRKPRPDREVVNGKECLDRLEPGKKQDPPTVRNATAGGLVRVKETRELLQ
jgi:hypothetical protein